MNTDPFLSRLLRAPDGADGGVGEAPAPGAGAEAAAPAAGAEGAAAGWWDGLDDDTMGFVTAKGLKGKPADEALKSTLGMYRNAEKALGQKGIPLPEKGTDPADWLAQNREALGLPKDAAGYEVKIPEGFDEATWDKDLAEKATGFAALKGVPPSVHQGYVEMFANYVQGIDKAAAEDETKATQEMHAALEKDWGKDMPTRIAGAQQAAQRLAEQAGLDGDALKHVGAVMTAELGRAPTLRMFDALARAMGDDTLAPAGGGGGGIPNDAASARSQLDALMSPDGEHGKAVAEALRTGNRASLERVQPTVDQLRRVIAAAGKKG